MLETFKLQSTTVVAPTYALTVNAGAGGTVTSTPAGINCPVSACSANFSSGASVTLFAVPASGYAFAGWSGACSGTGACTVAMSAAETVSATFNAVVTPATGYWWDPAQGGHGFVIQVQGTTMLVAGFLYAASGEATWVLSTGPMASSSQYSGALQSYSGGQTLTGPYNPMPLVIVNLGSITLNFSSSTAGTLTWPGGTIPIERFDFGPGGSETPQPAGTPQTGVWFNPAEGGRGFTLEIQGGSMYLAGYMYDANGNPVWYLATGNMTNSSLFQGQWAQFGNGTTLAGGYQPASVVNSDVGSVTLQFTSPTAGTLTLPNGRQIPLVPYSFGN